MQCGFFMSKPTLLSPAPDFPAPVIGSSYQAGDTVTLSQFQGQTVVLHFYPKDDKHGCTKQASALRDGWSQISQKALAFGISTDPVRVHLRAALIWFVLSATVQYALTLVLTWVHWRSLEAVWICTHECLLFLPTVLFTALFLVTFPHTKLKTKSVIKIKRLFNLGL